VGTLNADRLQMKYRVIFFIFCSVFKAYSQGSLIDQPTSLAVVKKGLYYIYNTETRKAEQYIHLVEELMPKHPVAPMMRALNINWSSNPVESDSEEFRKLSGFLQLALDRTKDYLHKDPDDIEAVFFAIVIYGWLAQFYDEDGHTFKALNAAKKAYQYMKVGFDLLDRDPEFYFSTGLYNYYRVQYPESNPVYKPFVWFFRSGNKELGLQQLDHASKEATFTSAEAAMYLAHIYLRYENKPQTAVKYSGDLVNRFPRNMFFKVNYGEALLAAGEFQKAYIIIQILVQDSKDFYRMSGEVFYGIYMEKHISDLPKAKIWYQKSLKTGEHLGARADNKKSLAYAGLARIADAQGDKDAARDHYKKAMKLAQYDGVKNQAKRYLRTN